MKRELLGGKIHSARVTRTDLEYEGSCGIDEDLLEAANILPFERIYIWNATTGARLDTYAIPAARGSGAIALNGAAARLAEPGDRVIIASYVQLDATELATHQPTVVLVDDQNHPTKILHHSLRKSS
jgi:aspartate 1-decarboxylase